MLAELLPSGRWTLLEALWSEGASGSVHSLARQTGVSYANAHAELKRLERAGLVRSRPVGNAVFVEANRAHPEAASVEALVRFSAEPDRVRSPEVEPARVLARLVDLGAPLPPAQMALGSESEVPGSMLPEEAVARGLRLAHSHPTLARAFPVLLARNLQRLDLTKLSERAAALDEKQALGFFLDLTGTLAGDDQLRTFARTLRDRRRKRVRNFFDGSSGKRADQLAEQRTPQVARDWLFRMDMDMDNFRQFFTKFAER